MGMSKDKRGFHPGCGDRYHQDKIRVETRFFVGEGA